MTRVSRLALLGGITHASFQIPLRKYYSLVLHFDHHRVIFVAQGTPPSDRQVWPLFLES